MREFDARLAAHAAALDIDLSDEALRAKLLDYVALIQRWTRVYNLTAVRNPDEMFTHHLLDCLAVAAPLRRGLAAQGRAAGSAEAPLKVLDVGSGAGLPGVVLAILNPHWQVWCVDAVAKKAGFIRQVAAELSLSNLQAAHGRVEADATLGTLKFDLITSRAFASLKDFTDLTRSRLAPGGVWAAMKAHLTDEEQGALPQDLQMFHVEQVRVPDLNAARCLVWIQTRA